MTDPNRDLMRLALTAPGMIDKADMTDSELASTISAARNAIAPAKNGNEFERTASLTAIEDALRPIGAKTMPTAAEEQGKAWLVAVAVALSDLPTRCVVQAARSAVHMVFRFPNEAEQAVRTMAEELVAKQERAIALLERLRKDLDRAANPAPAIEHQSEPWTVERLRTVPRHMIDIGLKIGRYTQEMVDEAFPDGIDDSDKRVTGWRTDGVDFQAFRPI